MEQTYSENCFWRFVRSEDFSLLKLVFKVVSMCCFVYLFIFIDPLDQARAPRGRVFGSEDLLSGCIAKGRRVGTGGKVVKLMVVKPTQKVYLFVSHVENEMSSYLFFIGGGCTFRNF